MGKVESTAEILDDWDVISQFSAHLGGTKKLSPHAFGISSDHDYILDSEKAKDMKQIILNQLGSDMEYDTDLRMFTKGTLSKKKRRLAHARWTKVIQSGSNWESDNLETTFDDVMKSVKNSDYVTITNVAVQEFEREIKAKTSCSLPTAVASMTRSVCQGGLDVS